MAMVMPRPVRIVEIQAFRGQRAEKGSGVFVWDIREAFAGLLRTKTPDPFSSQRSIHHAVSIASAG